MFGRWMTKVGPVFLGGLLALVAARAEARERRVPERYPTIQAAVDAAGGGDVIEVGPGSYCGATIGAPLTLVGHGATIVGCADGPLIDGDLRAGFYLPGTNGSSSASGTRISGFAFDGRGISQTDLAPLAVGVFARFANRVRVENNLFLGTVQAVTDTAGDDWVIAGNRIRDLTVFDCTGALCAGGDGIVIQIARDDVAAPGGPGAAVNRPERNVVAGNDVSGAIPDGFATFSLAGIFVMSADGTVVTRNRVSIPDNPSADADGDGVLVTDVCCGEPALTPGARNTVVTFNDGRDSQFGVVVEGTGGENTAGLVLFGNTGPVTVEGTLVDDRAPPRRPHRLFARRTFF